MSESSEDKTVQPVNADRMVQLWRRLKEHRIAQWTVGYIAIAYALQHGVVLTTESMDWPHTIERFTMILLALGLPVAMTLAWYHGQSANHRISGPELSIISILLVVGAMVFYIFVQPSELASLTKPAPVQAGEMSIAVLPFANLSGDANQEFFSDGMTDEIMTALSKVQALRVVGRESAYQFKGQKADNRAMGQALGARYLIEGSVRKAGDRVRITAQLVQTDNGVGLWTEAYDRELKDLFAVQEDIAQAIAGALRVPLGLAQGETLVRDRTDVESYDQYLRAKALVRAREIIPEQLTAALEALVARDPNYAPAWTLLSGAYFLTLVDFRTLRSGSIESARAILQSRQSKIEQAARRALQLDPRQAGAYGALATIQFNRGKWAEAEDLFKQALALDPNDPNIVYGFTGFLRSVGRNRDALPLRDRVRILEPLSSLYNIGFGAALMISKQNEQAIAVLEPLPPNGLRNIYLAQAYASAKRYGEGADTLLAIPPQDPYSRRSVEDAARLLREAPAAVKEPAALPALEGELAFVYAYIGATSRILEFPDRYLEIGFAGDNLARMLWHPDYAPLRKTERFKAYVRKAGLVDYWKARGWPDLCHPVGQDDFACD